MTRLPDPLTYYEKIFLIFLSCISLGLIGYSFNFYIYQLKDANNSPSNSVSLLNPPEGIKIPDVYIGFDSIEGFDSSLVFFECTIYRIESNPSPCPYSYRSYSNITFYQDGGLNIVTKNWVVFSFNGLTLKSNNIDSLTLYINTSVYGLPVQYLVPQIILYQRTDNEREPYRLEDIINKSYSNTPSGGIYSMTYSLTYFQPLNKEPYYLVSQLYNGFLIYDPSLYRSLIFLMPNSPLITINREFVPIGAFNVFSSIWSIISLCFLVASTLFTRQMPKIHLYFAYRNELSFILHFLTCKPCKKEENVNVSV